MKRKYRAGIVCCLALCLLLAACADMPPEPESSDFTSSTVTSTETVDSAPASSEVAGSSEGTSSQSSESESSAESSRPDVPSKPADSSAPTSSTAPPASSSTPPASSKPQPASSAAPVVSSEPPKEAPPPVSSEAPVSSMEEIRWPSDATDLDRVYYSNDRYIDETELDAMIADAKEYAEGLGGEWLESLNTDGTLGGFFNPENTRDAYLDVHGGLISQANRVYKMILDDPNYFPTIPEFYFKIIKKEFEPGYWLVYFIHA